jgi:acetyl esterase
VEGVPVRRYVPLGTVVGTTVYVHGGGWVVGTLDTYDTLCRELAVASGSTVVSVGYDLAPEARPPRQAEQVRAVARAVLQEGGPVALAGDSAGGYLAALTAHQLTADDRVPVGLAMIYPVVSPALDTESAVDFATGYYLETEGMRWYWSQYVGDGETTPLIARAGMPPTYVLTAELDPLRDEGRAYADALEAQGVPVVRDERAGQVHGFVRFTAVIGEARRAIGDVGAFLRGLLRSAGPS